MSTPISRNLVSANSARTTHILITKIESLIDF
jgi:hypothetical protein